jgi:hypothetical protein
LLTGSLCFQAQGKAKVQLLFISEEWLKSGFCRGELITLQEVVKTNPELEVVFVILASPLMEVDENIVESFPEDWKKHVQSGGFDVLMWAKSQLQLLSEQKAAAAAGITTARETTTAGRQTSREVKSALPAPRECSKCKKFYQSHEIVQTSGGQRNKDGKWHCQDCILTNIGDTKKSAKARDRWRAKLEHLKGTAQSMKDREKSIEKKCGGVYDMHYVWEWCASSIYKFVSHVLPCVNLKMGARVHQNRPAESLKQALVLQDQVWRAEEKGSARNVQCDHRTCDRSAAAPRQLEASRETF